MVMLQLRERDELAQDIAGQMIEPGLWLLPVVSLALGLALWGGRVSLSDFVVAEASYSTASAMVYGVGKP